MREARFFLVVRFSIDGGHVAEVLRQPGFLLYGIELRGAFDAYEANAALKAKFARERAPFERHMRIERFSGEVETSYAA